MIKNTEARLVDQTGAIYRLTPTVHMVSSDEIVLSTGTRFRWVHRGPNGQIPAEVAQELVLEGWLERIVRETAVKLLVLPDVGSSASTALSSGPGLQWSYSRWTPPPTLAARMPRPRASSRAPLAAC